MFPIILRVRFLRTGLTSPVFSFFEKRKILVSLPARKKKQEQTENNFNCLSTRESENEGRKKQKAPFIINSFQPSPSRSHSHFMPPSLTRPSPVPPIPARQTRKVPSSTVHGRGAEKKKGKRKGQRQQPASQPASQTGIHRSSDSSDPLSQQPIDRAANKQRNGRQLYAACTSLHRAAPCHSTCSPGAVVNVFVGRPVGLQSGRQNRVACGGTPILRSACNIHTCRGQGRGGGGRMGWDGRVWAARASSERRRRRRRRRRHCRRRRRGRRGCRGRVCRCAGVRACGRAGVRACGCAVCGYAGVRVCGCADVRECGSAGARVPCAGVACSTHAGDAEAASASPGAHSALHRTAL